MMTWSGGFETLRKNGTLGLFSLTAVDNHGFAQICKVCKWKSHRNAFWKMGKVDL